LEKNIFDWEKSLDLFSKFGDEVLVGTTTDSKDRTIELLELFSKKNNKVKIVVTDFKLDSPTFDGDIKNAALLKCSNKYRCLFDLDEFPVLSQRHLWNQLCQILDDYKGDFNGFLIPSINLCKDLNHYKDIGFKFYLHDDKIRRGVVNYAKNKDGSIDISKSDTTDAILESGELGRFLSFPNEINLIQSRKDVIPYVFHKWAVDFDKRIEQNNFWKPVWENRAKKQVTDIILDKSNIDKIEVFEHSLPLE